ncbi:hypoxanthine phosphoribosyltransferase [bacterium]|nr:hypoxanthine phosphoribosyltransferase [bacterium]
MSNFHSDISRIIVTEAQIRNRVSELGNSISRDYFGEDMVLVCILKGAFIFMSDLCRHIQTPINTEFMAISSYGQSTKSSGVVRILKDLNESIENRNVLIVEDIVDTGLTLSYIARILSDRKPNSLRICALLNKPQCHQKDVVIDYCGFVLQDEFVVGYGLDYKDFYRNLPYVGVLKPEIYTSIPPE